MMLFPFQLPMMPMCGLQGTFGVMYHSAQTAAKPGQSRNQGWRAFCATGMFLDDKNGWVGGIKGVMLRTADGGATWKRQDTGTNRHLLAVWLADGPWLGGG